MKHVFYLLGVFALLWELYGIVDTRRILNFKKSYKGKKWEDYSDTQKNVGVLMLMYVIWTFLGLLTSQWYVFLALILIGFIPKKNVVVLWLDSTITFAAILFVIINKYHLNINLLELILNK